MALHSTDGDATASGAVSPLVRSAERLARRIESLADEMARLRAENEALRREVREAVALFDQASSALDGGSSNGRATATLTGRRRRGRPRATKGRATDPAVTPDVVRAVMVKLGDATAAEIAREITAAGVRVSGRAVRFLAERAGAETYRGDDGQRRYRLGI